MNYWNVSLYVTGMLTGATINLLILSCSFASSLSLPKRSSKLSAVDHEVCTYNDPFNLEIMNVVVESEGVKTHIGSGRFGKRHVYIFTVSRIAHRSFTVTDEKDRNKETAFSGSRSVPAGMDFIGPEWQCLCEHGRSRVDGYDTAHGIVFAYRLHAIRPMEAGGKREPLSDSNPSCSGEAEDDEYEEMEVIEVNEVVLCRDLDLRPCSCDAGEHKTGEGEGSSCAVFQHIA